MNSIYSFFLSNNHSSVNHGCVSMNVSDEGILKISTQGQTFKVHTALKSAQELQKQLPKIQAFFDKLFYNKIQLTEGKIKNLKISIENKKILVQFSQALGTSSVYEEKTVIFGSRSMRELFPEVASTTNSSTPIMQIDPITSESLIGKTGKAFKRIINFFLSQSEFTVRLTEEFKSILSKLPTVVQKQIYSSLQNISKEENQLAFYLKNQVDLNSANMDENQLLAEILKGGYVIIDDDGKTYDEWCKNFKDKHARLSSHVSNGVTQYAIRGPIIKECLFSTKEIIGSDGLTKKATWFQLERYPAKMLYHIPHLYTWVLYKFTGQNQGPYGKSPHREQSNPLVLKLKS